MSGTFRLPPHFVRAKETAASQSNDGPAECHPLPFLFWKVQKTSIQDMEFMVRPRKEGDTKVH